MAIPLLDAIEIADKEVNADAFLTRRKLADYLVRERQAHYHFTIRCNQPGFLEALKLYFRNRGQSHFIEHTTQRELSVIRVKPQLLQRPSSAAERT